MITDSLFAPDSFWYQPIQDAPLHADSAVFVADFLRQKQAFYGTVGTNTITYTSPVYIAEPDAPTVQVTMWNCQNKSFSDEGLSRQWAAVPIPTYAQPADGTDGEMTIYQPSTETLWEFWKARKTSGKWQACWGGRLQQVSRSEGIWPLYYGTTATGLPFLGGQVTAEELQRGEIKHAIGIALVQTAAWNVLSWPAKRGDGNGLSPIPEGIRFRLDPSINVDALPMHPIGKIIAKAAQKYGFVVWDKAGAIVIRAQNPKSYTAMGKPDPYVALWNGSANWQILDKFPWDHLQFLPKDYGK